MDNLNPKVASAVRDAVMKAIAIVGVDGLRAMSMFPSSQKDVVSFKLAA